MTVFVENNLQITIPAGIAATKFDGPGHGLGHCMKAVDFIVELKDRYLFIEFKDPQHPNSKFGDRSKFIEKFLSGNLDEDLKYKYRDSFLNKWATGKMVKPVFYYVLIALDKLTEAELITRTDDLKRKLPLTGPASGVWKKNLVAGCAVFNIETWNNQMSSFPVTRVGA